MMTPRIQLGSRVRRRNDIGLDAPGAVVRLNEVEALVFFPDDNFYQKIPVSELEIYDAIPELIAA